MIKSYYLSLLVVIKPYEYLNITGRIV